MDLNNLKNKFTNSILVKKKSFFIFFILILFSLLIFNFVSAGWTEQQNSGSRVWTDITSSADGTKLAATVGFGGYIYTSTDSGTSWVERQSAGARYWTDIASSADGTKLVATVSNVATNGYIYTSTDSGNTWFQRGSLRKWTSVVSSADGVKLVATASGSYVYTSIDSGLTWQARIPPGQRAWTDVSSSADGTQIVAVASGADCPWVSWNSGADWSTNIYNCGTGWRSLASSADGTKIVSITPSYIYTSTDNGSSQWVQRAGPLAFTGVASSADGTKLVATVSNGSIYTSTDSGENWTQTNSGILNWSGVASSADGTKLAATVQNGYIYTFGQAAPDFTVTETGGSTAVTEAGGTDTFTIVLDAQPATPVTFDITSNDTSAVTVNDTQIEFTNGNWNTPQTITVTGPNDPDSVSENVVVTVSVSDVLSDDAFDSLPDKTVNVSVTDNDPVVVENDINIFENKNPPINVGSVLQRKSGAFIVYGLRSTAHTRLDSIIQIPTSAGMGKVLTSDASGNATWQIQGGGGGDTWTRDVANTTTKLTNINDKVGIGTALPNNKLQVAGLINFNDTLSSTAVGRDTLLSNSGYNNTALGWFSLIGNTSGSDNTAAGYQALLNNQTGSHNTAVGYWALSGNIGGTHNTAVGYNTLANNLSGSDNTAIGHNTLTGGTNVSGLPIASGSFNTAIGREALYKFTTGSNNTGVGSYALSKLTTGSNNTAIGYNALIGLTTGSNNTAIGFGAGSTSNFSGPTNLNNVTAITFGNSDTTASGLQSNTMVFYSQTESQVWTPKFGFGTQPQALDAIRVGTNSTNGAGARLSTAGQWLGPSDRTKKHDIENISVGLKEILSLRPVDFKWNGSNKDDLGFIAQEVKPILPKLVSGEEGDMAISYSQMTAVLTRAIQEQQEIIEDYKEKINIYTKKVEELEKQKLNKFKNE